MVIPKKVIGTCKCGSTKIKEEPCSTGKMDYFLYKCQECNRLDNADGFSVLDNERRQQWAR